MDNVQKTYIILQPWLQDLNKGEQEELIQLLKLWKKYLKL